MVSVNNTRITAAEGVGLGLRIPHLSYILQHRPAINWFEVPVCNFLRAPFNRDLLHQISAHYPLSFHGVSLNLGGSDQLNQEYLSALKRAVDEFQPALISEHACFTAHQGQHFHDLLPVPYTQQGVQHFVDRLDQVQNVLGRKILIENVSRYCAYTESEMSEAEFLAAICHHSGCGLVLDLNNIYVNQMNFPKDTHLSLEHFIRHIPLDSIGELHLAGHSRQGEYLVDTHGSEICDPVWDLYSDFLKYWRSNSTKQHRTKTAPPCLIEWDNNLPTFSVLQQQGEKAQLLMESTLNRSTPVENDRFRNDRIKDNHQDNAARELLL